MTSRCIASSLDSLTVLSLNDTGIRGLLDVDDSKNKGGLCSGGLNEGGEEEVGGRVVVKSVALGAVMFLCCLLTVGGNTMVLHAVRTERKLQTVCNMFIVSLAIADLTVGLVVMPISAVYVFTVDWRFGVGLCQFWTAVDYTASTASILNLFVLSLDRYWSVTNPLKYLCKRTRSRGFFMIAMVWVISSLWIVPIVGWHHFVSGGVRDVPPNVCDTEYATNTTLKIVTSILNYFLPLTVMYALYTKIFIEIRNRSRLEIGQRVQFETISTAGRLSSVHGDNEQSIVSGGDRGDEGPGGRAGDIPLRSLRESAQKREIERPRSVGSEKNKLGSETQCSSPDSIRQSGNQIQPCSVNVNCEEKIISSCYLCAFNNATGCNQTVKSKRSGNQSLSSTSSEMMHHTHQNMTADKEASCKRFTGCFDYCCAPQCSKNGTVRDLNRYKVIDDSDLKKQISVEYKLQAITNICSTADDEHDQSLQVKPSLNVHDVMMNLAPSLEQLDRTQTFDSTDCEDGRVTFSLDSEEFAAAERVNAPRLPKEPHPSKCHLIKTTAAATARSTTSKIKTMSEIKSTAVNAETTSSTEAALSTPSRSTCLELAGVEITDVQSHPNNAFRMQQRTGFFLSADEGTDLNEGKEEPNKNKEEHGEVEDEVKHSNDDEDKRVASMTGAAVNNRPMTTFHVNQATSSSSDFSPDSRSVRRFNSTKFFPNDGSVVAHDSRRLLSRSSRKDGVVLKSALSLFKRRHQSFTWTKQTSNTIPIGPDSPQQRRVGSSGGTSASIARHRCSRAETHGPSSALQKEIKAARQLGVIMGAFTVCFLPYFVCFTVVAFCDWCVGSDLMTAVTWVGYINSTLNPFLYPLCNLNFRRKFRQMLRLDSRRRQSVAYASGAGLSGFPKASQCIR